MITELTAADLTAMANQGPRELNVSTLQLRKGDRFEQVFVLPETNGTKTAVRTVEVTGRSGGQLSYGGEAVDVWFVQGMEVGGAQMGKTVHFTATDHMRWGVIRIS